ncbi:ATP-binding protein [Nocardioides speluncae]|uniref:ATP-binding protein n=1 Tax=Nocardioides speluncae TaxID=2670337 RepID=UPI00137B62EC|nr:tetratricopeptide repeat protein [Nocardioides speluncae]
MKGENVAANAPAALPVVTAEDLGRELKRWLRHGENRRLKVAALAKRLEMSQSTLYAYLAGTTLPATEVLDDLLRELGVPTDVQRRLATARDALHRDRRRTKESVEPTPVSVPRELPADPSGFSGREAEIEALDRAFSAYDDHSSPVGISVIAGIAGVGKTALAVRWARRLSNRFPDGCLYLDLLGFSPGEPRDPAEALARFLRALGAGDDVPDDLDERASRFRSRAAGKRLLVVLDNALDVEQVRPLLPASPESFVVVTSRSDLPGLRVHPGAHLVSLGPLAPEDGMRLLTAQLPDGPVGLAGSTGSARTLVDRCGGLPLALRIVAAQAQLGAGALDELAADLTSGAGLDLFDVGDPATSVRGVFSWSERRLPAAADAAFRLLGVPPVQQLDLYAATALLGTGVDSARGELDELVRAHLMRRLDGVRFSMHDLLREHARERAEAELPEVERDAAMVRLVRYWIDAGGQVMDILHPPYGPAADPGDTAALPPVRSTADAHAWVDAEWENLLAAVAYTELRGWHELTIGLAQVVRRHVDQAGRYLDAVVVLGAALRAGHATGDRVAEASAHRDLGVAYLRLGRHDDAVEQYRKALEICHTEGDVNGEAGTLNNLGNFYERLGRYDDAIEQYTLALPLARTLDHRSGEATVLGNLAVCNSRLGHYDQALALSQEALELFWNAGDGGGSARTLGNIGEIQRASGAHGEALLTLDEALTAARDVGALGIETEILNTLGETHLERGSAADALASHQAALTVAGEIADRYEQARALEGSGHVRERMGERHLSRALWQEALTIYSSLGLPEAGRVRALLDHADGTARLTSLA